MASRHHDHIKNDPRWHAAREECFDRDDWTCQECGSTVELQADHIVPLAVLFIDGPTPEAIEAALDVDNLRTLCRPCNGRKGDRVSEEVRVEWINPDWQLVAVALDEHRAGSVASASPVL